MNNKDHYTKYVYKPYKGSYMCMERHTFIDQDLDRCFYDLIHIYKSTYIEFEFGTFPAKVYKDKHGNFILRIFHDDIKQTKIDFDNVLYV